MLVSTLDQFVKCDWCGDIFTKIAEFIKNAPADIAPGRYDIDGDDLYASVSSYDTKPLAGALPETHQVYADVQVLLAGKEFVYWCPAAGLKEAKPYDPEADIAFFEQPETMSRILLQGNTFTLLFPGDAHMPQIAVDAPEKVVKVVFKVKLSRFSGA